VRQPTPIISLSEADRIANGGASSLSNRHITIETSDEEKEVVRRLLLKYFFYQSILVRRRCSSKIRSYTRKRNRGYEKGIVSSSARSRSVLTIFRLKAFNIQHKTGPSLLIYKSITSLKLLHISFISACFIPNHTHSHIDLYGEIKNKQLELNRNYFIFALLHSRYSGPLNLSAEC
jgi:hypothetical protein